MPVGLFSSIFRRMKDPVRGQAQVVSCSMYTGSGIYSNCSIQLVVQAEGVPATSLRDEFMVKADKWPSPGMALPVTVDRADPTRVKIEWDEVESSRDRAARNADVLASMMRGQAPEGGLAAFGAANVQVVDLRGDADAGDDGDEVDEQLARLAKLGQLRDAGVLTPEEFEEQKRRILEG